MSIEKIEQLLCKLLHSKIKGLKLVILFGSVITDNFIPNQSDIDIAFLSDKTISNVLRWDYQEVLAAELNCDVDLIDLATANDVLKFQIATTGKVLYKQESIEVEYFLDRIYLDYLQLNEDRAEILEYYR